MPHPPLPHAPAASSLAAGYNWKIRTVEILSIVIFFGVIVAWGMHVRHAVVAYPWLGACAILLGYIGADFTSGLVHWMADTWGHSDVPVIGKALIRPFREHHVDPEAITRHDFVETNGNNCLISIPVAVWALMIARGNPGPWGTFASVGLGSLVVWVMATNQFHKWSHTQNPPALIAWLQRLRLILPRDHHAIHHRAPFNRYYCITVGWLNWPLTAIGFFPALERVITAVTGLIPREDDLEQVKQN